MACIMDGGKRARRLVVVSLDGLSSIDFKIIKDLPHFKELLESGSLVRKAIGIYPTLTYPLHASIITGTYPRKHGIVANNRKQPGQKKPDWFWFRRDIKVPTLYDIARSAGLRVGSLLWPTTGGAKINYNLPEIFPTRPGQNLLWLVLSNGTPLPILDLKIRFGRLLKGISRHNLDNFIAASAAYLIRAKKPDLLLIHLLDLDATRHRHGFLSREAEKVLHEEDQRLGRIMEAARQAGTFAETAFIVLGDHAYQDVRYRININTALKNAGLLSCDSRGRLTGWTAWANACDGSAHIYLKDPEDASTFEKVTGSIASLQRDRNSGLAAVFNREQIRAMRIGEGIDFILEAESGYYFTGKMGKEVVEPAEEGHLAAHGYLPDREGYSSLVLAAGAGIRKGAVLDSINIVDLGPTMAALLGLRMPDADGRLLEEILNNQTKG